MLEPRSVTVASDEALCLFTLANFDLKRLTSAEPTVESRMKILWSQVSKVSRGLVFSQCPSKLTSPGFRWAPSSFLGTDNLIGDCVGGLDGQSTAGVRLTDRGLIVPLPGAVFETPAARINVPEEDDDGTENGKDKPRLLFRRHGDWYLLMVGATWNEQAPLPVQEQGTLSIAILLEQFLTRKVTHDPAANLENNFLNSTRGVTGLVTNSKGQATEIRCWRHVSIVAAPPAEQYFYDAVLREFGITPQKKKSGLSRALQSMRVKKRAKAEEFQSS
ncbi:MAG: hypothetical protein MMC23_005133 [Stictis urceolatum]|nr:hypothetical protein [Stictis urceolata]